MSPDNNPVRIGIVAGEVSGDMLGAGLMRAIKLRLPNVVFEGIGGPRMAAEGCESLFPMEKLSIIGLMEALGKFVQVLKIRRALVRHFIASPPDIFIGVDVPDFNLGLEQQLKAAGIPTVHYVSPTVWAWRGYRIRKIHKSVDRMLTLFPFEADYYRNHNVPVSFVGHPMAEQIEEEPDRNQYREQLNLPKDKTIVALLPGSRSSELHRHADVFVKTVAWLTQQNPDYVYAVPFVSRKLRKIFNRAINRNEAWDLPIVQLDGHSREVMAASDIVLLASGTATLEAALLKRLMVVTYKVSMLTYYLVKFFSHVRLYSLPNNLAGEELVPEYLQSDATPDKLGAAIIRLLSNPDEAQRTRAALNKMHRDLKQGANDKAADAIIGILESRRPSLDPVGRKTA